MTQVVKTRVGDDARLVAELVVIGPGQRREGGEVPLGNVDCGHGAFPVALVRRDGAPCP